MKNKNKEIKTLKAKLTKIETRYKKMFKENRNKKKNIKVFEEFMF